MNHQLLIECLQLPLDNVKHLDAVRFVLTHEVPLDIKFMAMESLTNIHQEYNRLVEEKGDTSCLVGPNDSVSSIRKKCKKAFKHGEKHYPMWYTYAVSPQSSTDAGSGTDAGGVSEEYPHGGYTGAHSYPLPIIKKPLTLNYTDIDSGLHRDLDDYEIDEAMSSTERVRKYYKRHPEKVRKYLKDTVKDRVARNRDRRKAVKKHGKSKMNNHDVHHPKGPNGGSWRLAKKDHGRDKVKEDAQNSIKCRACGWEWKFSADDEHPFMCHKCWNQTGKYLMEGGAAGHLAHPFEDEELTFKDMKEMIDRGLLGGLDAEAPVTEKLDGQNIAFSIRDGQIVFARNKGHVKNRGKNALDVAGIRQMFAGRGNIEKAFTGAAEDLQAAVGKLTPQQIEKIFADGSKFMSLEVILPDTQNVIPYGKSVLVMHGGIEYDEDGNEIGRSTTDGKEFADAVTAVGADKQKTFGISGPKTIAFSDAETEKYQQKAEEYTARLDRAAAEFGLDEKSTLAEYRRAWWEREITSQIESNGLELSEKEFNGLIERWADGSKKFGVKDIDNDETKKWFREFEKNDLAKMQKAMIKPIETTFLQAGTDSLRRVTNFLSVNNPEASAQLKNDVLTAIKAIRDSNDPDVIGKLQRELERLESIGMDNVVPSEGVVFIYNGKPYKFTGQFAPINQITGTFKFGMAPAESEKPTPEPEVEKIPVAEPEKNTQPQTEPTSAVQQPKRTVAIFTGRFQPFHAGHYSIYKSMVDKFGKDNVYIASSNVTDATKSPFDFNDKKKIMSRMFGIPDDKIVQVKNPYAPVEVLEKEPENTTYVTAVSQKDAERLGKNGKYFRNYEEVPEKDRKGFKEQGYFIVAPEMQLTVNGKNISGTQLRAVMGDPKITDRAKEEIFTKVYGKFDPEVFKKIVSVTTSSEEARKLTDLHGKTKPVPKQPVKASGGKKASPKAIARAKSVLKQKIENPKTKRKIYVATALRYDPSEPVRKAAEKLVQQAMNVRESVITENKTSSDMNVYVYVKDYDKGELSKELKSFINDKKFPKLAQSSEQLIKMIEAAPDKVLTKTELSRLENSEVGVVLSSDTPLDVVKRLGGDAPQELKNVLTTIKAKEPLSMPVVIKTKNGMYLMTGNLKLSALAAVGHTMPVKLLVTSKSQVTTPASVGTTAASKTKKTGTKKEVFKKILQMKITNPETGNQIKIDTAMDYDKQHPAHKIAMGVIRQHMKGISNRAGVPKHRKN